MTNVSKFLIIDQERAIITSANFTHSSLEIGKDPKLKRNEIGLYTTNSDLVEKLSSLFKDIYLLRYNAHYPFKGPEKDKIFPVVYSKQIIHEQREYLSELINSNNNQTKDYDFVWTYDIIEKKDYPKQFQSQKLLKTIKKTIEKDKYYVLITTYSINSLENTLLDELLIKKVKNQNVEIVIIVDVKNKDRIPEKLKELENCENFSIFYHPGLHAKCVVTSRGWVVSTANLDGNHGLLNSFEVGISGINDKIHSCLKRFFVEMLSECPNSQDCVSKIKQKYKLIICKECGKSFNSDNALNQHFSSATHQPKTIECLQCDKKFKTEIGLNHHAREKH